MFVGSSRAANYFARIRGLGIVNVRDLFGVSAVAKSKKIELCIEFKKWKDAVNFERLGLDAQEEKIPGVKIAKFIDGWRSIEFYDPKSNKIFTKFCNHHGFERFGDEFGDECV
ncbi:MAG: hypothetical protein ACR2MG_20715 [Pyrinomonadaceae bacterium]